jgi:hypothetical protein
MPRTLASPKCFCCMRKANANAFLRGSTDWSFLEILVEKKKETIGAINCFRMIMNRTVIACYSTRDSL